MLTFQKQLIPFWPEMKQHSKSRAKKLNRNKTKEIVSKSKKVKSLIRGTADVVNQLFILDFFLFAFFGLKLKVRGTNSHLRSFVSHILDYEKRN